MPYEPSFSTHTPTLPGMYEDAVSLALGLDLDLAKSVASLPPEEEESLRRKLWLAVARHVVQRGAAAGAGGGGGRDPPSTNIKQAVEFLREAGEAGGHSSLLPRPPHTSMPPHFPHLHISTGGLLKLEDILPFFPDFVMIDNFKDAICDSLERYNRQVLSTPR